jgi:hypothetical protein
MLIKLCVNIIFVAVMLTFVQKSQTKLFLIASEGNVVVLLTALAILC